MRPYKKQLLEIQNRINLKIGDNLLNKKIIKINNKVKLNDNENFTIKKGDYFILNQTSKMTSAGSKKIITLVFVTNDNRKLYIDEFNNISNNFIPIDSKTSELIDLSNLRHVEPNRYVFN